MERDTEVDTQRERLCHTHRHDGQSFSNKKRKHSYNRPMQSKVSIATMTMLLALMVAGCGGGSTPTTPTPTSTQDALSGITNLSPSLGTNLSAGQTVTFTGTTRYTLNSADTGVVVMVLEDQAHQPLQPARTQAQTPVARGTGEATLSQTITLPGTGVTSVRLLFVLAATGASSSTATVSVSYFVQ